jgi:hypothetical protein
MDTISKLEEIFGDYRAEWATPQFADLYVRPPYMDTLEQIRPCMLIGGRGTGKTVALKSLRFDAPTKTESSGDSHVMPGYLGVYVRLNKNRVRAFQGGQVTTEEWSRVFGHYMNLLVLEEFIQLADWIPRARIGSTPSDASLKLVARTIGHRSSNLLELAERVQEAIADLELYVNNPFSDKRPTISIAEAPLRTMAKAIATQFLGPVPTIFVCLDEYENLLDYQQSVLNTYIKHADQTVSYKVGVRRFGLRTRHTIDASDLLRTPEDYSVQELTGERLRRFCRKVVDHRLRVAAARGFPVSTSLETLLPAISRDDEAKLLGAEKYAEKVTLLTASAAPELTNWIANQTVADQYLLYYWAMHEQRDITSFVREMHANKKVWRDKVNNYGAASLYWLSKGRKGARIRKYYSGARMYEHLAAGNIRYLLELVDEALLTVQDIGSSQGDEGISISPVQQTQIAQKVARRRLEQLSGLSERGVELKRLVLGVGKIFFEYARQGIGRTPEVTSFVLNGSPPAIAQVRSLLREGVSHLAFEATPRTKPTNMAEMRDDDEFRLHPILAPFFEIPVRKKRRITLNADDLILLQREPQTALKRLIKFEPGEGPEEDSSLPVQLNMFSEFYGE